MDSLSGKLLINKKGERLKAEKVLQGKEIIVYYFSAKWCAGCKPFEELLNRFYKLYKRFILPVRAPLVENVFINRMLAGRGGEEVESRKAPLEIIFVSCDNGEVEMMSYFKQHGNWYAIPFGDPLIKELQLKYGITGIPILTVVRIDGVIVTRNGKKELEEIGVNVLGTWL